MRFSEKLQKIRKENNLSQEQLADKLGISRQAVSKWESGSSYPDMEKMLQICKILNCHLEDIMDDGSIGQDSGKQEKKKIDFYSYMKDFLDFITRTYNMFCSMKFKEKIKCVFEMTLIAIILFIASKIVHYILKYIIYGIIPLSYLWNTVSIIIVTMLIVISTIIFIHLFKIRYLDYFITVEDQNVIEKHIEEPIEKKENKYYQEMKKEKVIIRDPKHSTEKFFYILGDIIVTMIKALAILAVIPIMIIFVITVGFIAASVFYISENSILFLFIAIAIIGISFLEYDLIELLVSFIAGKQVHFRKLFIIGIIGLIMCGTGIGLSVCNYLNYENVYEFEEEEYLVLNKEIEMTENLYISNNYKYDYNIENSVDNIKIEIKYFNEGNAYIDTRSDYCYFYYSMDKNKKIKMILNDLKNKQIRKYNNYDMFMKVTITTSQENYNKLQENYNKVNYIK